MRHHDSGSAEAGRTAMTTPICDFVRAYAQSKTCRLHMPGHKGASFLGMEHLDITEIQGVSLKNIRMKDKYFSEEIIYWCFNDF